MTQETLHIFQTTDDIPNNPLYEYSEPIPDITKEIQELAVAMGITLARTNGFGLAAPQVGVNKRVIIVKKNQDYIAMINPIIIHYSKRVDVSREGCLSIQGGRRYYDLGRKRAITVEYLDLKGKMQELKAAQRLSYCIQHEIDHLDGLLINGSKKGVPCETNTSS